MQDQCKSVRVSADFYGEYQSDEKANSQFRCLVTMHELNLKFTLQTWQASHVSRREDLENSRNRAYRFSKEITMAVILQINRYRLIYCIVIILSWYLVQISISVIFLVFHSTITGTAIGWFLVTCPWLKSMFSRSWYIKQCTPLGIHYSTWSKHGGKWHDRRWEKHCQFSFSWMNTTTPTWSLKLKSNDFQSYPRKETAASRRKRW